MLEEKIVCTCGIERENVWVVHVVIREEMVKGLKNNRGWRRKWIVKGEHADRRGMPIFRECVANYRRNSFK